MLNKLSDKLRTLILMGTKQAGSYDPNNILCYIEEELTGEEAETAFAFLKWVYADKEARYFGHGNIDGVYSHFLAESGIDPEKEEKRRGQLLADILMLKLNAEKRYSTTWGTKSALGLYRSVKRIIEEGE